MDINQLNLRLRFQIRSLWFLSKIAVFFFCVIQASCSGNSGPQSSSVTLAESPTHQKNGSTARSDRANATTSNREIGEQCLMRGRLALSSSQTVVQAISEFHCTLTFFPDRAAEAHRGLGEAYAKIGNVLKAIKHYSKYLELNPQANARLKVEAEIHQLERVSSEKKP